VTPELIAAAVHLADTLAHENHALAALDLPRAAGLLDEKTRAMDGFVAAQAMLERGARGALASDQGREAEQLAGRLRDLALENRRLLEHAIAVQGRVIGLVAHAVRAHRAAEWRLLRGRWRADRAQAAGGDRAVSQGVSGWPFRAPPPP
jgi:hypothetical protein